MNRVTSKRFTRPLPLLALFLWMAALPSRGDDEAADLLFPPELDPSAALDPDPTENPSPWLQTAFLFWSTDNAAGLASHLDEPAGETVPDSSRAAFRAALAELQGDDAAALQFWPQAADCPFVRPSATARAAAAALRLHALDRAGELIDSLGGADPVDAFLKAAYAWRERNIRQAWRLLIRPASQPGNAPEFPVLMARVSIANTDFEEAIGWLRRAFDQESDPDRREQFVQAQDFLALRYFPAYRDLLAEYLEKDKPAPEETIEVAQFFRAGIILREYQPRGSIRQPVRRDYRARGIQAPPTSLQLRTPEELLRTPGGNF